MRWIEATAATLAWALVCLLFSQSAAAGGGARTVAGEGREPSGLLNVVLLLTDDQRFDALGVAGNPLASTPNLDALAGRGVLFKNAFCTSSICPTSRASFLTGQYASRHGVEDFGTGLLASQLAASWRGALLGRGYSGGFVGKWGLGGQLPAESYRFWRGFAGQGRYFRQPDGKRATGGDNEPEYLESPSGAHLTRRLGDAAVGFLGSIDLTEAFFLQLSFKAPHGQDEARPEYPYDPRF